MTSVAVMAVWARLVRTIGQLSDSIARISSRHRLSGAPTPASIDDISGLSGGGGVQVDPGTACVLAGAQVPGNFMRDIWTKRRCMTSGAGALSIGAAACSWIERLDNDSRSNSGRNHSARRQGSRRSAMIARRALSKRWISSMVL